MPDKGEDTVHCRSKDGNHGHHGNKTTLTSTILSEEKISEPATRKSKARARFDRIVCSSNPQKGQVNFLMTHGHQWRSTEESPES